MPSYDDAFTRHPVAPPAGGIDPNTGEWSPNPQPPHVAGGAAPGGGQYGVNGNTGSGQATNANGTSTTGASLSYGDNFSRIHPGVNYGTPQADSLNVPTYGQAYGGANNTAQQYSDRGAAAQSRQGIQVDRTLTNQDRGLGMQSRGQSADALGLMRDAAYGRAPSAAQLQMGQGVNDSIAAQMAMANSARGGGGNIALAQRQAASQGAAMQQQGVAQSAQLRAQEMAQARGAYSQAAVSQRAQDLQAQGLDAQSAMQQAALEDAQRARNDQYQLGYEGLGASAVNNQLSADTARYGADKGVSIAQSQQNAQTAGATMATVGTVLGGLAMSGSDARIKEGIVPLSDSESTGHMLDQVKPYRYGYKDPARHGEGLHYGVMAQDLEKSPVGASMVQDTPEGKMIDLRKANGVLLASAADMHHRIRKLEARQ